LIKISHMGASMNVGNDVGAVPQWELQDRIQRARRYAGLEQGQLAELAGVSRKSVSNWEIGKTVPRRSALIAIAFATGVNLYWLETGESPYPPEPVKDAKPGNSMV